MERELNLSIIIPVYNGEKTICKCLDSVLKCPYNDYEVIVIDDGSVDDTDKILEHNYANKIKLIKQKNAGVSAARNKGVLCAQKDYLMFLDSDDIFCDNWWEKLEAYKENDITLYNYIREKNDVYQEVFTMQSAQGNFDEIKMTYILTDNANAVCAKIYKRKLLLDFKIQFPQDMKIGEDAVFFGKVLQKAKMVNYYPRAFYVYVDNLNSASYQKITNFDDQKKLYEFKKNFINENNMLIYEEKFYIKFLGDFISRLRQSTGTYAHFSELILSAERYGYIKWLINFKYETLPLRRKIQVTLLKIKAYRVLFFELKCESLVNEYSY